MTTGTTATEQAAGPDRPAPKKRVTSFDAFRGIAIILVVFAHATGFGWGFQDKPGALNFFNLYYSVFMRNLALFSLPLFLLISGYWLGKSEFHTRGDYWMFLRKRVSRIAVPYLFWSVFFLSLYAVKDALAGESTFSVGGFLLAIALGKADGPYYFILLILQFYVLAPFFCRVGRSTRGMAAMIALHALVIAALYYVRFFYAPDLSYIAVKLPFLAWLSIFPAGVYLRHHPKVMDRGGAGLFAGLALLLLVLEMAESAVLLETGFHYEFGISDIRVSSILYAFSVVFFFVKFRDREWPQVLVTFGEYAFGIFFIHGIVLRTFAKGFAPLFAVQPAYQTAISLSTLAVCCLVIFGTRRVVGRGFSSRFLGF